MSVYDTLDAANAAVASLEASLAMAMDVDKKLSEKLTAQCVQFALLNKSALITDAQIVAIGEAVMTQFHRDVAPRPPLGWGVDAECAFYAATDVIPGDAIHIEFHDSTDSPGAAGYHTRTANGMPIGMVFLQQAPGMLTCIAASHECIETAIDLYLNRWSQRGNGMLVLVEPGDPFNGFYYPAHPEDPNSLMVSAFALEGWYDDESKGPHAFQGKPLVTAPFSLPTFGYCYELDPKTNTYTEIMAPRQPSLTLPGASETPREPVADLPGLMLPVPRPRNLRRQAMIERS